jgi:hypothetical protein
MPRTQMIDGVSVPLTNEEETARDAEEVSWEEEKPARAMSSLRKKRNILLAESDWTQGSDTPLNDGAKTEWSTYRQSLRH